jgi:hypothetical protein
MILIRIAVSVWWVLAGGHILAIHVVVRSLIVVVHAACSLMVRLQIDEKQG